MGKKIDFETDSEILKALGHPLRLKMVAGLIKEDDCNVNKMVQQLGIPQSTASQHLGILKTRGIIRPRKDGVKTCYSVVDERVKHIISILES